MTPPHLYSTSICFQGSHATKPVSNLQDPDVAFFGTEVEAGLPGVVFHIDIGSQVDQIRHHQVVVVRSGVEEGGLWTEGGGGGVTFPEDVSVHDPNLTIPEESLRSRLLRTTILLAMQ